MCKLIGQETLTKTLFLPVKDYFTGTHSMGNKKALLIVLLILCSSLVAFPIIETVNATEDTWITLEPMPTARSGLGVADGKIYAIGGSDGNSHLDTTEMYNPETDT